MVKESRFLRGLQLSARELFKLKLAERRKVFGPLRNGARADSKRLCNLADAAEVGEHV
ncbi:hypothetical protein FQZ97_1118020 [compost metagenome]